MGRRFCPMSLVMWIHDKILSMKISLKYKLLSVLILLPVVTIIAYIFLITDLFERDKMAYVFESGQSISSSLSNQFNAKIRVIIASSNMLLEGIDASTNKFSLAAKKQLNSIVDIDRIYIVDQNTQEIVTQISKFNSPYKYLVFPDTTISKAGSLNSIKLSLVKDNPELYWLARNIINKQDGKNYSLVSLCNLGSVIDSLKHSSIYNHFVFDIKQNNIIYTNNSTIDLQSWNLIEKLSNLKSKRITFQQRSPENKKFLITASKTALESIVIVSIVEKDKALSAIKLFIRKSLVFLALAISLAILIGLFASSRLTRAFRKLNHATNRVSEGDFNISLDIKSGDEVEELAENFNIMGEKISELMIETEEKARMEAELQTAQLVQSKLFPPNESIIDNYIISGHCTPASECGGDWWHYHDIGDYLYIWLGDATGHGASAALMTSAIASSVEMVLASEGLSPRDMINLLNKSLIKVSGQQIFMTFFMARITKSTGQLTYCNSGHEPPLLFKKDDKYSKKNLIPLNDVNGPRLCEDVNTVYEEHTIQLEKNDTLLLYTDGITEAKNSEKQDWGEGKFIRSCIKNLNEFEDLSESKNMILSDFQNYIKDTPLDDDVTFFLLRYC